MLDNPINFLIILLIVLAFVWAFFAVLEYLLKKSDSKKNTEKKKTETKPVVSDKPSQAPETPQPRPAMRIYNSELADDLNKILKESDPNETARLQIKERTNRESNISKYIQEKKYHGFDFSSDNDDASMDDDAEEETLKFTREDYKKFMALSNIKDKKPL